MARPKTKSALVDGMSELVDSLRSIESKLNTLLKSKTLFGPKRGPGRPVGSFKLKSGSSIISGKRKPGRPKGSVKKKGPGRPPSSTRKRGRGRPPGSKNKK